MPDQTTRSDRGAASWERLAALMEGALARSDGDRTAFLGEACGSDRALLDDVRSLLDAHAAGTGPVERIASTLAARAGTPLLQAHRRIGPYAIVREIGSGGMGVVYLARRADGEYDRYVALKVARGAIDEPRVRERFLAEREILANLSHPGIATFFDGGVTEDGHPYYTMEYVQGQPIDAYCDAQKLGLDARLRLFLDVCDAVAAAHRSLVVHRDLKPGNVLVTREGTVRLLDFGIAKLLDPLRSSQETTGTTTRFFSRDFASPEQVCGRAITTASDVYSLGAMLYLLLTGAGPHRFAVDTPGEVERAICHADAVRPSVAAPDKQKRLRGDLDTIVLKALNKEPERRYPSVEAFAEDIRAHLESRPIAARPEQWSYRIGKFVRRHKAPVAAAVLLAATVVAGVIGIVVQAQRARTSADRAQKVSRLLTDLFSLAEPGRAGGSALTARALLDQGAARIETELAGDPATQAEMYAVVGRVYANLALHEPAARALERSLALRERTQGPGSLAAAGGADALARLYFERNEYARAEALYRRALGIRRAHRDTVDMATTLAGLGAVVSASGRHAEAEPLLREALELRRRAPDETGADLVDTLHELALVLLRSGKSVEAAPLFREAVERGRRDPRAPGRIKVSGVLNLARIVHLFERRPRDAEPLYREALGLARELFPPDHPEIATCLADLSRGLRDAGKPEEAESTARAALAMWRRLHGERHREVVSGEQTLAEILADRGQWRESERRFRSALANAQSVLGQTHPLTLRVQSALADFLFARDRVPEALHLREAELAAAERAFGTNDVYVARALTGLGVLHASSRNLAKAEPYLRRSLEVRERIHPRGHWRIAEAQLLVAAVALQRRRYADAEALLRTASAALESNPAAPKEEAARARRLLALAVAREPGGWSAFTFQSATGRAH